MKRTTLANTTVLALLIAAAVLVPGGPASAHGYCQTHNQIQIGTRAWAPTGTPTASFFVDGVKGSVDVPAAYEVSFKQGQSIKGDGYPAEGFFTGAMITLSNQESHWSGFADEVSLGWYMGEPLEDYDPHHFGPGMGYHETMPWTNRPVWFMRETVPNVYGGHDYRYQWFTHDPNAFQSAPDGIPKGIHSLRIERRNSMYNNSSDAIYDVYINNVRRGNTTRTHRVGNTPMAGGEVHGFPCIEMYSVFRENRLNNSTSATLRYHRYDLQTWSYFPSHSQRMVTWDPINSMQVQGPWGNASCFREQTLGHVATGYAYGPIDDGPGNYCPVPYT